MRPANASLCPILCDFRHIGRSSASTAYPQDSRKIFIALETRNTGGRSDRRKNG